MPPRFTARQGQFLAFIHRYTERHGIAPSFDDLARQFGVTSPSVNGMIKTLERNGLISRVPGAARTLRVEVPAERLPDIGFGRTSARSKAKPIPATATASTIAVAAASAVLDGLMPALLERGAGEHDVIRLVTEVATSVGNALARAGVSSEESAAATRRIAAEASRWQPDGRGVVVRRRVWSRRRG